MQNELLFILTSDHAGQHN